MQERDNQNPSPRSVYEQVRDIHRRTNEQMWLLRDILPYLNNDESYATVRKVMEFFRETILKHFEWEDREVFPLAFALGEIDTKQAVRELQQQHIFIVSKYDILADIIIKHGFTLNDEGVRASFIETSKEMLQAVLQHGSKEDRELYPFLESKNVRFDFRNKGAS